MPTIKSWQQVIIGLVVSRNGIGWQCTNLLHSHGLSMAHRKKDDFPSYKPPFMVGIFHGELLNNQMVHEIRVRPDMLGKHCYLMAIILGIPWSNLRRTFKFSWSE